MRTLTILADNMPLPPDVAACDVIVWDKRSVPCGQRSAPRYLEEHLREMRGELLRWVYDVGRAQIRGREVQDWLQGGDTLSMWWCSLLFEQHPKVTPGVWHTLKLRAIERMMDADDVPCKALRLIGGDARLERVLRDFCAATGRLFLRERPIQKTAARGLAGLYYSLPATLKAVTRFAAWLWQKRALPHTHDTCATGEYGTIATYFPNIDAQAAEKGRFRSRYWESFHDALAAAHARVHWLFIAFPSPQQSFEECLRLRDRFRQRARDKQRYDTYHYLEEFLGAAAVRRALMRYLRLWRASRAIERDVRPLFAFAGSRMNVWEYLGPYFADSFRGWRALERCLHREAMLAYVAWAGPQRWTIFPMENCPWERMLTEATHTAGHGPVYGLQHSTARPTDFRYFDDPRTFASADCTAFQPDVILANGAGALAEFQGAGVPQARLGIAEALRYMYLANDATMYDKMPAKCGRPCLLVVTSFFEDECEAHIRALCDWLRTDHGYDVALKPHPYLDVTPYFERYGAADIMPPVLGGAVGGLLMPGTVVWASNSTTVALEAALRGLQVLVQTPDDGVDLCPLQGVPGVARVSSAAEVTAALNGLMRRPSLPPDYLALDPALPRLRARLGL